MASNGAERGFNEEEFDKRMQEVYAHSPYNPF